MSLSLLERGRSRRAQQQAVETPRSSSPENLPSSPNPFTTPSLSRPEPAALATRTNQLCSLGERALKKVKLDSETEAEFRTYLETTSQDERQMMQFLHTLHVESMLSQSLQVPVSAWKSSPMLLKTIRKFIWAMLLLPKTQYYAGTNENTIIEAMRKSDVPNLPPVDSAGCDGLVKDVAREYSVQRSTFKKKVNDTLPNKKIDVATLTASLVEHSEHVNATLGLYHRVAFVRLLSTRGYSNAEFWTKVDDELATLHAGGPEDRVIALQIAYEDDIQAHGDPASSKHKTGTGVDSSSPRWLQILNTLVPQIQRFSRRQGTKRKRPSSFDTDTTDNHEDEQEEGDVGGNNKEEEDPNEQRGEETT
ncbi:hypothetical protein MSAN_00257300 [Mycena sanguinolenta]|uniref:Uncharacterized protein n=1 Tax=Mycena sanguinolenta TaxID=230812 RepID=A0A8H6ZK04_9AGAR|nr:hypothetical protein MSAN_00257300 [Mycena sanguinolenta]